MMAPASETPPPRGRGGCITHIHAPSAQSSSSTRSTGLRLCAPRARTRSTRPSSPRCWRSWTVRSLATAATAIHTQHPPAACLARRHGSTWGCLCHGSHEPRRLHRPRAAPARPLRPRALRAAAEPGGAVRHVLNAHQPLASGRRAPRAGGGRARRARTEWGSCDGGHRAAGLTRRAQADIRYVCGQIAMQICSAANPGLANHAEVRAALTAVAWPGPQSGSCPPRSRARLREA
jgi:hypothetical protein